MTIQEMQEKRISYRQTALRIYDAAIAANRGLTSAESADIAGLEAKMEAIARTIGFSETADRIDRGGMRGTSGGGGMTPTGPFSNFSDQLRSIINAGMPNGQRDERLLEVRSPSGLNESVGTEGGFSLQYEFNLTLLERAMRAANIAPLCSPFPVGPDARGIDLPVITETSRVDGSRFGGLRLYWLGEADQMTSSKPKFGKLHLEPHRIGGVIYLSDELIQDSTVLSAFVERAFAEEFSYVIDDSIIRGSGVAKPLGILNSTARVTVSKETGQLAATIVYENLCKMFARLPAASIKSAVWLVNQDTMPQLMTMTIGTGAAPQPVYLPAGGASASPYGTIFGRPVIPVEQCSTLGTEGDVILADFSRYLLSTRGTMQMASSIHLRFLFNETALRFVHRIDGMPDLVTAVTPAHGTATQSPFVTLETR